MGRPRRSPENTPTVADLAQVIRQLRRERGMTTYDLAFASGLHPTTVGPVELGKKSPMWDTLCLLAEGLGLTVVELVQCADHVAQARRRLPANEAPASKPPR